VYRSDDVGNEWTLFSEGLPRVPIHRLAINDFGDRIYAATAGGAFVYEISTPSPFERLPDDPLRLPRLIRQLLTAIPPSHETAGSAIGSTTAFILPTVGRVRGSAGSTFRSDVTLSNARSTEQDVIVAWLPQGNTDGPAVAMFAITLPPLSGDSGGTLTIADITDELRLTGLGSMIVVAVDAAGEADGAADIDGFARVWSASPCGSGSVSQSVAAVSSQAFGPGRRARSLGLRHDASYRTNVAIVNLSEFTREFTVVVGGERRSERFTLSVPPFSPVLAALPDRNYGAVALTIISDGGGVPWAAYGSTVDNASGDAWASVAVPLRDP
jgi:hypothetical protein